MVTHVVETHTVGTADEHAGITDLPLYTLPQRRIVVVVEVVGPQALVLLCVDEILDLARHPAVVVDIEIPDQPLDDPELVIRVDDLEVLRQPRLPPVPPQQAVCEAVKRADPEVADGQAQQGLDTATHLGRGLVGERNSQNLFRFGLS